MYLQFIGSIDNYLFKSLKMYRPHYSKGQAILQTIDFSTLKKNNTVPICRLQQNSLQLINTPNSPLLFLGIFALTHQTIEISEAQFSQFPFEAVPRQFQQFSHQKTASEIVNIFRKQAKLLQSVVQLLNSYPIFVHILQCWVRRRAMVWLQGNPSVEYMGNQHELLIDLSSQIRGSLLGLIATSLRMFLKIKFEMFPTAQTCDCEEELGELGTRWELQINFKPECIVSGALFQKQYEATSLSNIPSKASECGFLRRSKMADNEIQVRSGVQFKSVKKERGGVYQTNQIKRKGFGAGYGVTPKGNQLSTSTNGLKSQPFSIGYLNQHNISKIRQANPGSK